MSPTRSQAERDALTVEMGFALLTGALVAAAVFAAGTSPVWLGDPGPAWTRGLVAGSAFAAGCAFLWRVVTVLRRFARRARAFRAQPSQPGRTRPDS